jgi:starch phosphorylase
MDQLAEQALNLRWCWNHSSDWIWKSLDAELWENTQNPWIILLTVSRDKIASLLANPGFRKVLPGPQPEIIYGRRLVPEKTL